MIVGKVGMGRFKNPYIQNAKRGIKDVILWRMGKFDDVPKIEEFPKDFSYPREKFSLDPQKPFARWIGHSTYLIGLKGLHILTDPVWSAHCAPIPIRSLKRNYPPPMQLEDLPRIDLILISHNHYDHLDLKTVLRLKTLYPEAKWVVPDRLKKWFINKGFERVIELKWWEQEFGNGYKVTAVPAQHFSGRHFLDQDRTHWNGYVVEVQNKKIYFVGDTGYNEWDFKKIGNTFEKMDLSLIPIGAYSPSRFMSPVHVNPKEAVKIHEDVRSLLSLGMHWNTFRLSDEPFSRPPYDLYLAMQEKNLPFETFLPIEIGESVPF